MKKQDVLNRVLNSESSIFSKDDVVRLIESLDEVKGVTVTDIGSAIDTVMNLFAHKSTDLVDLNSAEFDLDWNKIRLASVDLDLDYIREQIEDKLMPLGEADFEE